MQQHEAEHSDVLAGQQAPPRGRFGQQYGNVPPIEELRQKAGRPYQRQKQAQRIGHATGKHQLQIANGARPIPSQRNADRAEAELDAAGHDGDAFFSRKLRVSRILVAAR